MSEPLISPRIAQALAARYGEPGRHYHGLDHIEALLRLAAAFRHALADVEAVEAAIWFHDAIYDSRAADNEMRSAELARRCLEGRTEPERLSRIVSMIEATATHALPALAEPASRQDAAMFLDMDLSIFAAAPPEFDRYQRAIRREYAWVDEAAWRNSRAALLRRFLERPHIFLTDVFRERFEQPARKNIERALSALGRTSTIRRSPTATP